MTAIATNKFRIKNAQNFLNSITNTTDNTPLYAFIGRPQSWLADAPGGTNVSESIPRTPEDNREAESYTMQGIMQMKRVSTNSVIHGIRNIKWETGMNYNPYRSDYDGSVGCKSKTNGSVLFYPQSLTEANYYAISAGFVYVCIEEGPGVSTVDPNLSCGTGYNMATGADGYKWKMVAQASNTELSMFETPEFFPVSNSTTNKTYQEASMTHVIPGGIYSIRVPAGGTGANWGSVDIPNAVANNYVKIIGDGTGLEFSLKIANEKIVGVDVTSFGTGYTFVKFELGSAAAGKTLGQLSGMITPRIGLGKDIINDLNAYFIIVTNLLAGQEGGTFQGFTVNNDYRTIGLISKPLLWGTSTSATGSVLDATTIIVLEDVVNINPDDIITIAGARQAYVVDVGTVVTGDIVGDTHVGKKFLRVVYTQIENDAYGEWVSTDLPTVADAVVLGAINTSIAAIVNPGYEPQSGDLLYYENRRPISRASDQNEYIRVVIEF